jgi:hypothetical protein
MLWVFKEKNTINQEINKLVSISELRFTDRIREEYIRLTKLARKNQAYIDDLEKRLVELRKNNFSYIKEYDNLLSMATAEQSNANKKLFGFHGMFDAYQIKKVTPEELK